MPLFHVSDSRVQHAYRVRVSLFLFAVILFTTVLTVGYQAIYTLRVLDAVEHDREHWQRPAEIIELLELKRGSVVADIGSGAGYFTLKVAPIVGEHGGVFAVDILREPLAFLWIRALLHHQSNVHIVHVDQDNPHLPEGQIDAVLIVNTYHEFVRPRAVLNHAFHALHRGGRLVLVDRGPLPAGQESAEFEERHHEVSPSAVEGDLRETGFNLISRRDRFIDLPAVERPGDRPENHPWWVIVACKP
jgi:SAM-dependent methyltransferase